MGEANLRFAKGEVDLAAQICMEIIRQVFSMCHCSIQRLIEILHTSRSRVFNTC